MKKVLTALIFSALLFSACSPAVNVPYDNQNNLNISEGTNPGTEEQFYDIQITSAKTKALSKLKAVMTGNENFFDIGSEQELNIKDLKNAVSSDNTVTTKAKEFTVTDLDADGIDEAVLWLSVNGDDYYGCEILRYHEEKVYGYLMWYREFNSLKEDGTFSFSSGAADSGFGKLKFDGNICYAEMITYSESCYDPNNEISVSFFVNGEKTNRESFTAEIQKQNEKKNAEQHDFTSENIEKYLAADISLNNFPAQ